MNDDLICPEIGQHVKCLLINNNIAEGYVMSWNLTQCIKLRSLDDESVCIIHHPDRDIVLTKIIIKSDIKSLESMTLEEQFKETYNPISLEEQFQKTYDGPSEDELRNKKLAELKILMAKQDKKIISEKIRSHESSSAYSPRKIPYQAPDWTKVKSPYMPGKLPRK